MRSQSLIIAMAIAAIAAAPATSLALALVDAVPAAAQGGDGFCSGCSCKGGPGFRLPNGKCVSKKQAKKYCDGKCYPAGTVDERDGKTTQKP